MKLFYVECEWDMGLNIDGTNGCYSSHGNIIAALSSINWDSVGYESWEEAQEEGLLQITEFEG